MIEQAGRFIGMLAADIVNLFRGRQLVPCTVEWDEEPQRPDVRAVFKRPVQQDEYPTMADLARITGATESDIELNLLTPRRSEAECCDSCEHGCWGE